MFKRNFINFLFVLIILTILLHSQEDYTIHNIQFVGKKVFSRKQLLNQISIRGTNIFKRYILRKKPILYSDELVQSELKRLERFYQSKGYLQARVKQKDLILDHSKQQIKTLKIEIKPGKPIEIGKINYKLSNKTNNVQERHSLLKNIKNMSLLQSGKRFTDEIFKATRELIINNFQEEGYILVKTDYNINIIEKNSRANIEWNIYPGPKCIYGPIEIKGNKYVNEKFIRKQLAFKQGETLQEKHISNSQDNIYNLGLFQTVNITASYKNRIDNSVPIEVKVKEAPRLNTQIGIGYGTEDQFRASLNFQRLNLFGGARRIELTLKHSKLEPYNINLKYSQPQFLTRQTTLMFNPYLRYENEPGYETRRLGFNLPIKHSFTQNINGSFNYYMERVLQDVEKTKPKYSKLDPGNSLYDKSGIILQNEWQTSQPLFFPEEGLYFSMSYKVNGYFFQSDFNYRKLSIDLRNYQKIQSTIFATRVKLGGIRSSDKDGFVPAEDKFYSGGSNSIRGWPRSQLGPKTNNNPVGGKSLFETNLELRYPIYKNFSGAIFTDLGNVWINSYQFKLHKLRYAAGIGFRYATPIGPVRIDLARPVLDEKKKIEIHLNIGQPF